MKKLIFPLMLVCCVGTQAQVNWEGSWKGDLKVQEAYSLPLVFHIKADGAGYSATMDSPSQQAFGVKMDKAEVSGENIEIHSEATVMTFDGDYVPEKDSIIGEFENRGMTFPLALGRAEVVKEELPYLAEDVKFENKLDAIKLAGTLTLPKDAKGPVPAVVLVSGSGPQNRNSAMMGHEPFKKLAEYLTNKGYAVLRYDDRGIGESEGNFMASTTRNFTEDALSAIRYLETRKEIDPARTGIIGHSEGGLIAVIGASGNKEVDFIVMLAGPMIPMQDIMQYQMKVLLEEKGTPKEKIDKQLKLQASCFELVKADIKVVEKRDSELKQLINEMIKDNPESEFAMMGGKEAYVNAQLQTMTSYWMKTILSIDPAKEMAQVSCPVLAIYGGVDFQVEPYENSAAFTKAVKKSKSKDYKLITLEKHNHLFQPSETGSMSEYMSDKPAFSQELLDAIGSWMNTL